MKIFKDTLLDRGKYSHTKLTKFLVVMCMLYLTFYTVFKQGGLSEWLLVCWLGFIGGDRWLHMKSTKDSNPFEAPINSHGPQEKL